MERVLIRKNIVLVAEVNPTRGEVIDKPYLLKVVEVEKDTLHAEEIDEEGKRVRPPVPLPLTEAKVGRVGILDIRNQDGDRERYSNGALSHIGSFRAWLEQTHTLTRS